MRKYRVHKHEVTQPLDQSYRLIPLTRGQNAIVDAEDFDFLSQWNWCLHKTSSMQVPYAARKSESGNIIHMHKILVPNSPEVDHRNGNGLDNRRKNLRPCTTPQNRHNRGKNRNNTSGYKGVCWCKVRRKWKASIMSNRKVYRLGYFINLEEADPCLR